MQTLQQDPGVHVCTHRATHLRTSSVALQQHVHVSNHGRFNVSARGARGMVSLELVQAQYMATGESCRAC